LGTPFEPRPDAFSAARFSCDRALTLGLDARRGLGCGFAGFAAPQFRHESIVGRL
jgi:hypothetical protein